jgi:thiosulfate/3-mercaptopyruvate sulfurtransferase
MIQPVVTSAWLADHRDEVVVADVRWYLDGRSGYAAYEAGHLPGAVFVDLEQWLADPPSPAEGRHPLPSPERFARGMSSCGIAPDSTVIAYDDAGGVVAARLVWLLRCVGVASALLDGGLSSFQGELSTDLEKPTPVEFAPRPWPADRLATIDEVVSPRSAVIDARPRERYRGDVEPVDARPGHIPGALNVPCREHLDETGRFLSPQVIRDTFFELGIVDGGDVISYCGSGVTACHNLLALEVAGLGLGRLYPGSWSQYSATILPASTGPSPR